MLPRYQILCKDEERKQLQFGWSVKIESSYENSARVKQADGQNYKLCTEVSNGPAAVEVGELTLQEMLFVTTLERVQKKGVNGGDIAREAYGFCTWV